MDINIFLFEGFETLDACGPVEILGKIETYDLKFYSKNGGIVKSLQGLPVDTQPLSEADEKAILFIPGAINVMGVLEDNDVLEQLYKLSQSAKYCLTVCTGAIILAKTGALDNIPATTNKMAFSWAQSLGFSTHWIHKARWVKEGKFYTSSGVSAGMDMSLGFVEDVFGEEKALDIANEIEYIWNRDATLDPFAK